MMQWQSNSLSVDVGKKLRPGARGSWRF